MPLVPSAKAGASSRVVVVVRRLEEEEEETELQVAESLGRQLTFPGRENRFG